MSYIPHAITPGQRITADLINAILSRIRHLTPIAGAGLTISQTPNGTRYACTPAKPSGFDSAGQVAFGVSVIPAGDNQITVSITPGNLFVADLQGVCTPTAIELAAPLALTNAQWCATVNKGTYDLTLTRAEDHTPEAPKLVLALVQTSASTPADEAENHFATIATLTGNPLAPVIQHILGDIYLSTSPSPLAAAWQVYARDENVNDTTSKRWYVRTPRWTTKARDFSLADTLVEPRGSLWAILEYTVSAIDYTVTPVALRIESDITSLQDEPVVVAPGTSSNRDGTYYHKVFIGEFNATLDDEAEDTAFTQTHLGVIVCEPPFTYPLVEQEFITAVETTEGGIAIKKATFRTLARTSDETTETIAIEGVTGTTPAAEQWTLGPARIVIEQADGEYTEPTPFEIHYWAKITLDANGNPTLTETTTEASRRQLVFHADDHTGGVL